jgi:hypothetical protein
LDKVSPDAQLEGQPLQTAPVRLATAGWISATIY